jgi:hypothetical protein
MSELWLEGLESLTPHQAYSLGSGWLMVSPKQWLGRLPTSHRLLLARALPDGPVQEAIATNSWKGGVQHAQETKNSPAHRA